MPTLYDLLEVEEGGSATKLQRAYDWAALRWHPLNPLRRVEASARWTLHRTMPLG